MVGGSIPSSGTNPAKRDCRAAAQRRRAKTLSCPPRYRWFLEARDKQWLLRKTARWALLARLFLRGVKPGESIRKDRQGRECHFVPDNSHPAPADYFLSLREITASPVRATANKPIVLAASGTRGGVPAKSGLAAKEDWQSSPRNAQTNNDFFIKVDY